jgi:hypothetical protein
MFNNRIVTAQKELLTAIFSQFGKNYKDYNKIVDKYNSIFKLLAAWMLARDSDEFAINDVVNHLNEYIKRKKLSPDNIKVSKSKIDKSIYEVTINENSYDDLMELIEFVHGEFPIVKQQENSKQIDTDRTPVLTGDGIKIFKVDQAQDSRQLAGDTSWCIAYSGANNLWQSYRSNRASTFYIVWDENPPNPNQRKVALDFNNRGSEITDIPNRTGQVLSNNISFEYEGETVTGNDIPTYLTYLRSKGVDIDAKTINPETGKEEKVLQNKPLSEEEILASGLSSFVINNQHNMRTTVEDLKTWATGKFVLNAPSEFGFIKEESKGEFKIYEKGYGVGRKLSIPEEKISDRKSWTDELVNPDATHFGNLYSSITLQSDEFKTYLTKFIGMGWILPSDIFEYLFDTPGGETELVLYVNTGLELPKEQVEKIQTKKQLFNSYVKQQLTAFSMGHNDGKIIKNLDPDIKEDRDRVIYAISQGGDPQKLPIVWIEKIPQIGLVAADELDDLNLTDPLAIKLAIAKGLHNVYKKYPTLENTRIYLQIPDAIEPLRAEALANDYPEKILNSPGKLLKYKTRFREIPKEFQDLPEFSIYKNIKRLFDMGQRGFFDALVSNKIDLSNEDDLQMAMIYALEYNLSDSLGNDKRFWDYFFENIDKFQSGAFRRINLEVRDLPLGFDDGEDDEIYYPFKESPEYQKDRLGIMVAKIPARFLLDSTIDENVKKYLQGEVYVSKLLTNKDFDKASQYIKSLDDIPMMQMRYLFDVKNPIIDKFIDENFIHKIRNFGIYDVKIITNLIEWYPQIRQYITYNILFNLIQKDARYGSYMEQKLIPVLFEFYPDFFKENVERLKISDETKNMIRQKLSLQTPEEPTIASLNIIVKIARTLDTKKKYILADKLTKIIGKYNVQQ